MSTVVTPEAANRAREPSAVPDRRRWLMVALLALGVGLAAVAVLGPLVTGLIDYRVTGTLRDQTIGLDAVSLFLVAPLCVLAATLTARRHAAGPALALGLGAYTSYMFVQYIVGPDYAHLAGNNERMFPLALALFAGGWMLAALAWSIVDVQRPATSHRRDRLIGRVLLPVLALLAFSRYLPAVADWMSAKPKDAGYLAGRNFAWAIAMLDLGVFLPLTIATCAGLPTGAAWARKALYTVVGWFGLVGPAVAAMAIAMYVNDDPNASAGNAAFMTALGLVFAALAVFVYRPLFAGPGRGLPPGSPRLHHRHEQDGNVQASPDIWSSRGRKTLASLLAFIALNAFAGGCLAMSGAEGVPREWLEGSPFHSYFAPGVILFVLVGGSCLAAAVAVWRRHRLARTAALGAAGVLLAWLAVELIIVGYVSWMQPATLVASAVVLALARSGRSAVAAEE